MERFNPKSISKNSNFVNYLDSGVNNDNKLPIQLMYENVKKSDIQKHPRHLALIKLYQVFNANYGEIKDSNTNTPNENKKQVQVIMLVNAMCKIAMCGISEYKLKDEDYRYTWKKISEYIIEINSQIDENNKLSNEDIVSLIKHTDSGFSDFFITKLVSTKLFSIVSHIYNSYEDFIKNNPDITKELVIARKGKPSEYKFLETPVYIYHGEFKKVGNVYIMHGAGAIKNKTNNATFSGKFNVKYYSANKHMKKIKMYDYSIGLVSQEVYIDEILLGTKTTKISERHAEMKFLGKGAFGRVYNYSTNTLMKKYDTRVFKQFPKESITQIIENAFILQKHIDGNKDFNQLISINHIAKIKKDGRVKLYGSFIPNATAFSEVEVFDSEQHTQAIKITIALQIWGFIGLDNKPENYVKRETNGVARIDLDLDLIALLKIKEQESIYCGNKCEIPVSDESYKNFLGSIKKYSELTLMVLQGQALVGVILSGIPIDFVNVKKDYQKLLENMEYLTQYCGEDKILGKKEEFINFVINFKHGDWVIYKDINENILKYLAGYSARLKNKKYHEGILS